MRWGPSASAASTQCGRSWCQTSACPRAVMPWARAHASSPSTGAKLNCPSTGCITAHLVSYSGISRPHSRMMGAAYAGSSASRLEEMAVPKRRPFAAAMAPRPGPSSGGANAACATRARPEPERARRDRGHAEEAPPRGLDRPAECSDHHGAAGPAGADLSMEAGAAMIVDMRIYTTRPGKLAAFVHALQGLRLAAATAIPGTLPGLVHGGGGSAEPGCAPLGLRGPGRPRAPPAAMAADPAWGEYLKRSEELGLLRRAGEPVPQADRVLPRRLSRPRLSGTRSRRLRRVDVVPRRGRRRHWRWRRRRDNRRRCGRCRLRGDWQRRAEASRHHVMHRPVMVHRGVDGRRDRHVGDRRRRVIDRWRRIHDGRGCIVWPPVVTAVVAPAQKAEAQAYPERAESITAAVPPYPP